MPQPFTPPPIIAISYKPKPDLLESALGIADPDPFHLVQLPNGEPAAAYEKYRANPKMQVAATIC
jgi:hypothetical protein